jgi:ubiquinone/menaquinone biosynthesis C-methylase UbiE
MLDYEYKGLMAQTWDLLRGDPTGSDDTEFYLEMIARYGQPVLDVGCGTGRLLLDFLAQGLDISGVDHSPEMLAICRDKAQARGLSPTLFEQSMEALALPRRYATILAPSSALQLVIDPAAVQQAMACLHAHLLPGGALVAPFMTFWQEGMPLETEWEKAAVRAEDGATVQRMSRIWYDPRTECAHTEDLYQVLLDGEIVAMEHHRRSPASRSYTQRQARRLFEQAGFGALRFYYRFTAQPAMAEDTFFTVVGVKE